MSSKPENVGTDEFISSFFIKNGQFLFNWKTRYIKPYVFFSKETSQLIKKNEINTNNHSIEGIEKNINLPPILDKLKMKNKNYLQESFLNKYNDLKIRFLNNDYLIKLKNEKIKRIMSFKKNLRFKEIRKELNKEIKLIFLSGKIKENETFNVNYFSNISKKNYFKQILSLFFEEKNFNKMFREIIKNNEEKIKFYFSSLFLAFEKLGAQSLYNLYCNDYIKNNEITVYKGFIIKNEEYLEYINRKKNSYNNCIEFLITNLNIDSIIFDNKELKHSDYKIILKIKIKTDGKHHDFLYLSPILNKNFNNEQVLIRYGSILKIYKIKQKELKNGESITILYSKLLGACESYFQALINNDHIEEINLSYNYSSIHNESIVSDLCETIKRKKNLKILNLHYNKFDSYSMENIFESIKINQNLKKINLSNNLIGSNSDENSNIMTRLCDAILYNKQLEEIDLSSNFIGDSSIKNPLIMKNLGSAIKNSPNIKILNFSMNFFFLIENSLIMKDMWNAIKINQNLINIDLSFNCFGKNMNIMNDLCETLKINQNLRVINLSGNDIGSASINNPNIIKELCDSFKSNKHLKKINLSTNKLGSSAIINPIIMNHIFEVIQYTKNLEKIDLSFNELDYYLNENPNFFKNLQDLIKNKQNFEIIDKSIVQFDDLCKKKVKKLNDIDCLDIGNNNNQIKINEKIDKLNHLKYENKINLIKKNYFTPKIFDQNKLLYYLLAHCSILILIILFGIYYIK